MNHEKRALASRLIESFANGAISNDYFVEEYPQDRSDLALREISSRLWYFYDDLHEHTLTGKHALTAEGRALFARCCDFLGSDFEYEWPPGIHGPWLPMLLVDAFFLVARLVGFKDASGSWEKRKRDRLMAIGDYESWPFMRAGDLEAYRAEPRRAPSAEGA